MYGYERKIVYYPAKRMYDYQVWFIRSAILWE